MSAEMYRAGLLIRRQEIVIARMRAAIGELAEIGESAALCSPEYGNISARLGQLKTIGQLTTMDIAREFGPKPPDFDPDREIP